ncbi:MAG TPA: serine/threonine-protein kinase [Gemmataceae bacterium]|nr:serine/threonine-protein kinase [Gemmataceae bacterium]
MPTVSAADLTDALRESRLLEAAQLNEIALQLQHRFSEPRALARELMLRSWLTPYQANQLLLGRGDRLLLGSYVLLERLGEGGMGQVFKARNWKLGRVVAVKVIRKERLDNAGVLRRFRREIRAAAQLDHPNIVRALDADEVNGTHLLVMDYVPGTDLAKVATQGGPLPAVKACDYCRQAALGLQHAHERGLVHRDVKPSNLLLTPDGVVKILDMGLARWRRTADQEDESSSLTREGTVMGTADYIAPEQAMNSHTVDGRADLYSLGCTLYFLLTGRVPFPGGEALEKLMRHRLGRPEAIERLRPGVPAGVAAVVRRLMSKQPADRYPSAAAAAEALAAAAQGSTPQAPAPAAPAAAAEVDWSFLDGSSSVEATVVESPRRRPPTRWPSPRLLLGGASAAALLALGLAGLFLSLPSQPVSPTSRPAKPEPDMPEDAAALAQWARDVAALPAERQEDAVTAELRRRNPGFHGEVKCTVANGAVAGLDFLSDQVTDLSPLRALPGLTDLSCRGSGEQTSRLSDLSPLKGLPLTTLDCSNTAVADLSPVKEAKLTRLNCSLTRVGDLTPLKDMKLTSLDCGDTRVADLAPLRKMPLTFLACPHSPVSDLAPLEGAPLTCLRCEGTPVSDLAPLRGAPLVYLACANTSVSDLAPLTGMQLNYLDCAGTKASDLAPLKHVSLTTLYCDGARIGDLSALKGTALKTLHCDFDPKRDAGVLRSIRTLETINGRPAAEVLKAADAAP